MLVARYKYKRNLKASTGMPLKFSKTSDPGSKYKSDGIIPVIGESHKWFANVMMKNGLIKRVS